MFEEIGGWWLSCDHMFRRFGTPFASDWIIKKVNGYLYTAAIPAEAGIDVSSQEYGYRYGWERFWGEGDGWPTTGVFVDQFETRGGAAAYAADLARNDADLYGGVLRENPPHLPGGCRLLTVEDGQPAAGLPGPAAFAWCGHGVFSVSVTAVAGSVDEATDEVEAVLHSQLGRLPPG